ncbi:Oidioi.mRNA.OKI2018_I69.chr2.g6303.t1.cds [Oikopleura dioica]|uniref:Oidioi.mRNA.OKI2018_I69.chr2.g6303.t1.cds n=1 Tax=Oikopleura dioica TaxID=34765 RepID=A0ABN7T364_OIKDI|nr:Oidioi.mRNA.OKI2018_I69.chr2.g6303.t1.cds [Oikopleura dioica]
MSSRYKSKEGRDYFGFPDFSTTVRATLGLPNDEELCEAMKDIYTSGREYLKMCDDLADDDDGMESLDNWQEGIDYVYPSCDLIVCPHIRKTLEARSGCKENHLGSVTVFILMIFFMMK